MGNFRKMDEMEMHINLMAIRSAWVFSLVFLLIWVIYGFIKAGSFNSIAFVLMTSQIALYWVVQLYLKWKIAK